MKRGVSLFIVGSLALISLAGCGRGLFQFESREPWRAEAEAACLKSGAIRESADLVRIKPISGPGVCGAEFPLKVAALGDDSSSLGFADDLRPPGSIGGGNQPRWPAQQPRQQQLLGAPPRNLDAPSAQPGYAAPGGPVSLNAPGIAPAEEMDGEQSLPTNSRDRNYGSNSDGYPGQARYASPPSNGRGFAASNSQDFSAPPRLGMRDNSVAAVGPVALKPAATLACPIVSALDRWLADAIQPAAMRWFGSRVVEIRQISAYSCRGMNGNSRAHISEHAFGNALDIAAFTLADGRQISVKNGWKGMPEEQGFLRDVQAAACDQFTTVLAPGSNVYHYDHIHVDLMRRASKRSVCKPVAVSGEEIAARVQRRNPYASSNAPAVTGSIGKRKAAAKAAYDDEEDYRNE